MSDQIPLMFQAQILGRCQIQKLEPKRLTQQQAYDWSDQWCRAIDLKHIPQFDASVQTKDYAITWRMVTNSGQDVGVIRPVIGASGWAFFPGSSMKGAFRRACASFVCDSIISEQQVKDWCGGEDADGSFQPGILRFHGGYPKNAKWINDSLVDVVHPQENWQLDGQKDNGAFIQISLYQPTFVFGISSNTDLSTSEWETIWRIWDRAIGRGIGSRVSAGYGQTELHDANQLLRVQLWGEGIASQRINKDPEFRPNSFKAALRGHTRRLLSGVADEATAKKLTQELWGGFGENGTGAIVGKLGIAFSAPDLELREQHRAVVYDTGDAVLDLLVMQDLPEQQRKYLRVFLIQLIKFSMLLGGFGKSWRRVDHRRFFPEYLDDRRKIMIGCHWEFLKESSNFYVPVKRLQDVTRFLDNLQTKVEGFPLLRELSPKPPNGMLKERWRKGNVEVWGRFVEPEEDSEAVKWFHGPYRGNQTIAKSELTGKMGQIGRIWHRMYPCYLPPRSESEKPRKTDRFVELLTIFPNRSGKPEEIKKTEEFLKFLKESGDFEQLW